MSTQLLVKVMEVSVPAGGVTTVSHGLKSNNKPVKPTLIQPDRATPVYVTGATDTTATFANPDLLLSHTLMFRFERGLSNEMEAATTPELYWQGMEMASSSVTVDELGEVPTPAPVGPTPIVLGAPVTIKNGEIINADAASPATAPAIGFYVSGDGNLIRTSGVYTGLSGLPANATVYLAVGGGITTIPPSGPGQVVQLLGETIGTTGIFINPLTPIYL